MTLDTFIQSPDPIIANAATLTNNAVASLKAGQITADEYSELLANILDFTTVVGLTNDMNRQNQIANAFNQIKNIASILTSIPGL